MKRILLFLLLSLACSVVQAQTRITALSHEQAAATAQTITADGAGTAVDITNYSQVLLTVRGTYVVATITFEASPDATNYFPLACTRVDSSVTETASGALTNTTRAWRCHTTGFTRFRTGASTDWTSGTVNVTITPVAAPSDLGVTVGQASAANLNATVTGTVSVNALPAGTNNIGDVDVLTLPSLPTGANTIGGVNLTQYTPASGRLPVDGSGVTQPVSASSLPLPTGAATAAKQPALGTAGSAASDVITVQGIASMTALKVDGSAVTQPVSGTITANAGTGNFTVIQGTASSLKVEPAGNVASGATDSGNPIKVGGVYNSTLPTLTNGQRGDAQLTAKGQLQAVLMDAAGNGRGANVNASNQLSVSVDNTVTVGSHNVTNAGTFAVQAAQSGTWTVQPGNTANTTAWLVTGTGGTFPATQSGTWNINNISGTVSLPTGASTSANQLLTHTPITPGTATATKGELLGYQYNSTQATFTDGQQGTVQGSARGALYVATGADTFNVTVNSALPAGTNAIGKLAANSGVDIGDVDVTSVPTDPFGANADAASATGSISAKLRFIAATGIPITGTVNVASHAVTNAGTFAVQDSDKLADDAAFTAGTTKVEVIGAVADESSTDSVNEDDIGAPRMTLDRVLHVAPGAVSATSQTALSSFLSSAASTNSTSVKGSAGNVYMIRAINTTSTLYYLRMYNSSSAPTCSSATGFVESIPIPASTTGAGFVISQPMGQAYSTGVGFCLTGGGSSTDNTNAATGVYLTILYK